MRTAASGPNSIPITRPLIASRLSASQPALQSVNFAPPQHQERLQPHTQQREANLLRESLLKQQLMKKMQAQREAALKRRDSAIDDQGTS